MMDVTINLADPEWGQVKELLSSTRAQIREIIP
jgi:hypothetical protein